MNFGNTRDALSIYVWKKNSYFVDGVHSQDEIISMICLQFDII